MANWVNDFLSENPQLETKIKKRASHALHVRGENRRERVAFCTGAPMFYRNTQGLWTPMDTGIRDLGAEGYGSYGIPVRLLLDGTVKIIQDSGTELYGQVTKRVGEYDTVTRSFVGSKNIPSGEIIGSSIIQETGIYKHEIALRETGVQEYLTLKERPEFIRDNPNKYFVLDTTITGQEFDDGPVSEFESSGMRFSLPIATDANQEDIDTVRIAKKMSGEQHLLTGIRFSDLYNAVYPIVIDPDFSGSSRDGRYYGRSANYNYIKTTCTGGSSTGTYGQLGQRKLSSTYYIYRCFVKFDTSSIGADSTVTQVQIRLATEVNYATTHEFNCQIRKCNWSSYDPLSVNSTVYNLAKSASFDVNWCYTGSYGAHQNIIWGPTTMSTSWISKAGNTYYSLISSDDSIRVPTGNEFFSVCFAEHATENRRPLLRVTYTVPSASGQVILI